jgi:hypothetical protein
VRFNQESTQKQYALQEKALGMGWDPSLIHVIDGDLGISSSGRVKRQGFQQLVASVSLGEVGAVFGLEISRLARSSADLMKPLKLCGLFHTLVIDEDGIYDMSDFNDRLVIGLKGTMGEAEPHILRSRMLDAYGGAWNGKLTWGTLTHSRVLGILHNPAYAGAYVYGRYRNKKTIDSDGHFQHHIVCLPKEEWKVFLPGHHEAYITWDEYKATCTSIPATIADKAISFKELRLVSAKVKFLFPILFIFTYYSNCKDSSFHQFLQLFTLA